MSDTAAVVPAATGEGEGTPPATGTPPAEGKPPVEGTLPPAEGTPPAESTPPAEGTPKVEESDPVSPESYSDFTLPEGVTLDEAALGKAAPIFKELNLTQEQAQKLVDLQAEMVQEGARSQEDTLNQLIDGWQEESKNDKEFGGEKFEENTAVARLAVEKFGTPDFKQLMEDHGVGSHPEMIRFMWNIGKLLKEDVPGGLTTAASQKKDRIATLYPNS